MLYVGICRGIVYFLLLGDIDFTFIPNPRRLIKKMAKGGAKINGLPFFGSVIFVPAKLCREVWYRAIRIRSPRCDTGS